MDDITFRVIPYLLGQRFGSQAAIRNVDRISQLPVNTSQIVILGDGVTRAIGVLDTVVIFGDADNIVEVVVLPHLEKLRGAICRLGLNQPV